MRGFVSSFAREQLLIRNMFVCKNCMVNSNPTSLNDSSDQLATTIGIWKSDKHLISAKFLRDESGCFHISEHCVLLLKKLLLSMS